MCRWAARLNHFLPRDESILWYRQWIDHHKGREVCMTIMTILYNFNFYSIMLNDAFFQFVWQPYDNDAAVAARIPDYCLHNSSVWRSSCPLLCMHIVEWHHPDRVLRQFQMDQHIPGPGINLDNLGYHGRDLRGQTQVDWENRHRPFVMCWAQRNNFVFSINASSRPLVRLDEYLQWYKRHTWRWLDAVGGSIMYAVRKSYLISRNHIFNIFFSYNHLCLRLHAGLEFGQVRRTYEQS